MVGVYTRISGVVEWIEDEICRNSCFPPSTCHPMILHPCARSGTNTDTAAVITGGVPLPIMIKVTVAADAYPAETSIELKHMGTGKELWYVGYDSSPNDKFSNTLSLFERTFVNVPPGEIYLAISDRGGDGICCVYGNGYVLISNARDGHEIYRQGGSFDGRMELYLDINPYGKATWADNTPKSSSASNNLGKLFDPPRDDPQWPGSFYSGERLAGSSPLGLTINIRYDSYPLETLWVWEKLVYNDPQLADDASKTPKATPGWKRIDSKPDDDGQQGDEIVVYDQEIVDYPGLYRFNVSDTIGDGTCCSWGNGYFTITNATSVVWQATGDKFTKNMDAYIWVNDRGEAQAAKYLPGFGYALAMEHDEVFISSEYVTSGSATVEVVAEEISD